MSNRLTWLHLSDIHFREKTEWRDQSSRGALLQYLSELFSKPSVVRPDVVFCTGDIAFGHSHTNPLAEQYSIAESFFDELLQVCGSDGQPLPRERLFVVPGNHDVNRDAVNSDAQTTLVALASASALHTHTINQRFNDKTREFSDTMNRLKEYGEFVNRYLPHLADPEQRHVYGRKIEIHDIKVGIFGFNSAWTCAGPEDDRNLWLAAEWQFNAAKEQLDGSDVKIGLIHHPIDWVNQSEREVADRRIASEFDFWLHGHSHRAWVTPVQSHIVLAAGAVGAESSDEFGVNLCTIDLLSNKGATQLHTKKASASGWTIMPIEHHAPAGEWQFDLPLRLRNGEASNNASERNIAQSGDANMQNSDFGFIDRYLTSELETALKSFSTQPRVWVEPILSRQPEFAKEAKSEPLTLASELLSMTESLFIKALPQYGLTCLAKHLVREAWRQSKPSFWLYLDAKLLKPHAASINAEVDRVIGLLNIDRNEIRCVVVDSWSVSEKDSIKLLRKIAEIFHDKRIMCFQQSENGLVDALPNLEIDRKFDVLYLWALPRETIRKIVSSYNESRQVGDEDAVTKRLVSDLDVLNLHRTPLNCITLLKVSELDFDESPVNRSEMIKRVLFLLFNMDSIPTYKSKPDLKDCEHVLGYFCEQLVREGNYFFTRDRFLVSAQKFCHDSLIELDTHVVFDVLYSNNILLKHGANFYFRFSYWIFYFVAQRMHHDKSFAEYILSDMRYAQYPEIIEFYTGTDRNRDDAIRVIINDLRACFLSVKKNCGFPEGLNPYKHATWKTSPEAQEKMQEVIQNGIRESNLPAEIKDRYEDRAYDPARPYNQTIAKILTEHSVQSLMQLTRAASRALRNSDYVTPVLKQELTREILISWEKLTKVVLITAPILAAHGSATYDNAKFYLLGDFGKDFNERVSRICNSIPYNIVNWHQDDFYSQKMGPLLFSQLDSGELSDISRHELILLLVYQRPRGWGSYVQKYISSVPRNSFYLYDVFDSLRAQYRYGFASSQTLKEIEHLIKMASVKHLTGEKEPGVKSISKAKFKESPVPERLIE